MNQNRQHRQSFPILKPFTSITHSHVPSPLASPVKTGSTARASLPIYSYGQHQRSQSFAPNNELVMGRHLGNLSVKSNTTTSRTSSRRSSLLHSRRESMISNTNSSSREPELIRRGSSTVWSELQGLTMAHPDDMDPEEKRREQIERFQTTFNGLWHDGAGKLAIDLGGELADAWFAGKIRALGDVSHLGLSKSEYAHVIVETEKLLEQVSCLVHIFAESPELNDLIASPDSCTFLALKDVILGSSENTSTFLQILSCISKSYLKVQPYLSASPPSEIIPAIQSSASLCAFLTGSPVPFAHVFHSLIEFTTKTSSHFVNLMKDFVAITTSTPSSRLFGSYSFANHPNGYLYSPQHVAYQFDQIEGAWMNMKSQPAFKSAYKSLRNTATVLWESILGNSRVLRARRAGLRVWNSGLNEGLGEKVEAVLEGMSNAEMFALDDVSSDNDDFAYSFTNLKLQLADLIPSSISLAHSTTFGHAGQSQPTLTLSGVSISVSEAKYDLTKRGSMGFSDTGIAGISISSTVRLTFEPFSAKVELENVDVQLKSDAEGNKLAGKVWDMWLGYVVKAKLKETLNARIQCAIEKWLKPTLFPGTSTFEPYITVTEAEQTETSTPIPSAPHTPTIPHPTLPRTPTNPITARAAFLKSVQISASATSGGTVPPLPFLKTGRDLLSTLENPFSGPNSAVGVDDDHEEDRGSAAIGKKPRAMSMAASLSETAALDSTTVEHLQSPPRDRSALHTEWNVFPVQRKPTSKNVRRLSLAYTPIGEPSLEDYSQLSPAILDTNTLAEEEAENRHANALMADSLNERAKEDMSTLEGLEASFRRSRDRVVFANVDNGPVSRGEAKKMSMLNVTKKLTGGGMIGREDIARFMEKSPASAGVVHRKTKDELVGLTGLSEYLTEEATIDGLSTIDTTLPEHVAIPPIVSAERPRLPSKKSLTQLTDGPPIAEVGVDDSVTRDHTLTGSRPISRNTSNQEYQELNMDGVKENSMAARVDKTVNRDGLPEITTPPLSIDQ